MKIKTNEQLAALIDNLDSTQVASINTIISVADENTDFSQDADHKIAANIMFRYCDGEMDAVNDEMDNYELQSTPRPSPPAGSGGLWALIISIVAK